MKLEIKNLSKRYKRNCVLRDISLEVENGTCIGILGANGAGKSTLLSVLAGILKPDSGSFTYGGKELLEASAVRNAVVGYVPQGTPLISELNARDNLLLWYDRKNLKNELENGVLRLLGIDKFYNTTVNKMSGGMKKRLSIGCAVAMHPPVLLLDEPTAALDLACKRDIAEYLKLYKAAGGILFLTTHDPTELALCDRCYILKEGTLQPYVYDGNMDMLMELL